MLCGDGNWLPEPQRMALRHPALASAALALVDREDDRHLQPPQLVGEVLVGRCHPRPSVDEEERGVRLLQGALGLRHHAPGEGLRRRLLEACGVDGAKPEGADAGPALAPVPGHPGRRRDEGCAPADQPVEERRLADVGAAHDGDGEGHRRPQRSAIRSASSVRMKSVRSATTGGRRTAPPASYAPR